MRDRAWLREYAERRSGAAFAHLVRDYGPLVFSTCLREVRDRHLAEDVSQAVFVLLARKLESGSWRPDTVLAGWLYETARLASRNAMRQERRRRERETKAAADRAEGGGGRAGPDGAEAASSWAQVEPMLHAALDGLRRKDRDAILLRFYQEKPWKDVAAALGVSVDAAQARVTRAVDRLRKYMGGRGVVASGACLGDLLRANATVQAPPGVADAFSQAAGDRFAPGERAAGVESELSARVQSLVEGAVRASSVLKLRKTLALAAYAAAFIAVVGLVATATAGRRDPAALALLEKFAKGQARAQSFIVRSEDTSRWVESGTQAPATQLMHSVNEFRADAKTGRFARRNASKGDGTPAAVAAEQSDTNESQGYTSTLWDGDRFYTYGHAAPGAPDRLSIMRGRHLPEESPAERLSRAVRTGYAGAATMGYYHLDEQRVDRIAARARSLALRPEPQAVNGIECRVVEAVTEGGTYTLWLDPEHGFNVARAEVVKKAKDVVEGRRLDAGCEIRHVMEVCRFARVDGQWVAMEAREELTLVSPGSPARRGALTHRKTLVRLNPDFDATGGFTPDDVRDGTLVTVGVKAKKQKHYVWKSGRPEAPG